MTRISEVLLEAADVLSRRGWTKGHYRGAGDSVCAVGAIAEAQGHGDIITAERSGAFDHLDRSLHRGERHFDVTVWNDRQSCVEDVQHALRLAALEAASEGK